ncbi:uncharacterized protein LOC103260977 isoform X3 [Carlito syrichta]|uniref:Uncharacterized protein LOC103260977 isoform X3 n=1 Tax=Carlito syrichta TaxID=1868482 RepID=A0A1U7TK78_CARSF|nr:uncharacterized protein LOC103260977 isoform X3 [Carlito syrichta]
MSAFLGLRGSGDRAPGARVPALLKESNCDKRPERGSPCQVLSLRMARLTETCSRASGQRQKILERRKFSPEAVLGSLRSMSEPSQAYSLLEEQQKMNMAQGVALPNPRLSSSWSKEKNHGP